VTVDKQPETRAVEGARQLALEVHVSELQRSITWYQAIGFELVERKETFAVLGWDDARFFIKEHPQHGSGDTNANIRVMVPDVDLQWDQVETLGLKVVVPIDDRVYGLRDFTVADPDGFGIRFGTSLADLRRG
jgi:catechol 2,3-dioxygenase-like lactoylglutathione lyase family enzyme